jgi:hypothetical protein
MTGVLYETVGPHAAARLLGRRRHSFFPQASTQNRAYATLDRCQQLCPVSRVTFLDLLLPPPPAGKYSTECSCTALSLSLYTGRGARR